MTLTAKRTDAHTPSRFNPALYRAVAYLDFRKPGVPPWVRFLYALGQKDAERIVELTSLVDPAIYREALAEFWPTLEVPGTATGRADRCAHCGAFIRRIVVAEYVPIGWFIPVGVICAERVDLPNLVSLMAYSNADKRRRWQLATLHRVLRAMYPEICGQIDKRQPGLLSDHGDPRQMIWLIANKLYPPLLSKPLPVKSRPRFSGRSESGWAGLPLGSSRKTRMAKNWMTDPC